MSEDERGLAVQKNISILLSSVSSRARGSNHELRPKLRPGYQAVFVVSLRMAGEKKQGIGLGPQRCEKSQETGKMGWNHAKRKSASGWSTTNEIGSAH